jgi:deoxycytidylate deaminase
MENNTKLFTEEVGKCAKQHVTAVITNNGKYWIGYNWCGNPQEICPRKNFKTGEGYEFCKSICSQHSHAEVDACEKAGEEARGGIMHIFDHTYCCEPCKKTMEEYGIKEVKILN